MKEPVEETIRNGFYGWKKNPVLGVPYLAATVLSMILFCLPVFLLLLYALQKMYAPAILSDLNGVIESSTPEVLWAFVSAFAVCSFLVVLVNAFFSSAAIGMAARVAVGGDAHIQDILSHGRKKTFSVFIASLLIGAAVIIPAVLLLALAVFFFQSKIFSLAAFVSIAGFALFLSYIAILFFLSIPIYAAIVAGDLGAFEGIKAGFRFAAKNKLKVFFLLAAFYNLMWVMSMIFNTLTGPFYLFGIVLPGLNVVLEIVFIAIFTLILDATAVPMYSLWIVRAFLDSTGADLKRYP